VRQYGLAHGGLIVLQHGVHVGNQTIQLQSRRDGGFPSLAKVLQRVDFKHLTPSVVSAAPCALARPSPALYSRRCTDLDPQLLDILHLQPQLDRVAGGIVVAVGWVKLQQDRVVELLDGVRREGLRRRLGLRETPLQRNAGDAGVEEGGMEVSLQLRDASPLILAAEAPPPRRRRTCVAHG
jgi:hypothetical protein